MKTKTTIGERILFFMFAMLLNSGVFIAVNIALNTIPNFSKLVSLGCALTITLYIARNTYDIWNCQNKNTENENRIIELEKKIEELTKNK